MRWSSPSTYACSTTSSSPRQERCLRRRKTAFPPGCPRPPARPRLQTHFHGWRAAGPFHPPAPSLHVKGAWSCNTKARTRRAGQRGRRGDGARDAVRPARHWPKSPRWKGPSPVFIRLTPAVIAPCPPNPNAASSPYATLPRSSFTREASPTKDQSIEAGVPLGLLLLSSGGASCSGSMSVARRRACALPCVGSVSTASGRAVLLWPHWRPTSPTLR